jgi:hypothetical protein
MPGRAGAVLSFLALVALAGGAFLFARHWQAGETEYRRLNPAAGCELQQGECLQPVAGGSVRLTIGPPDIPLMQTLDLEVSVEGLAPRAVAVEIHGLNMDMGLNRTLLEPVGEGTWRGQTILPICTLRRMDWEAVVRIDNDEAVEVAYLFSTWRR